MFQTFFRTAMVAACLIAGIYSSASAQCPRCGQFHPPYDRADDGTDALEEVNAARAKRGKRPFLHDPQLTEAARMCATIRASRHVAGHLPNDFAYVPSGTSAKAAGCGALEPSWGWGTCCTYDNYTYAGAAWVMGNDGRRYMHLFVR